MIKTIQRIIKEKRAYGNIGLRDATDSEIKHATNLLWQSSYEVTHIQPPIDSPTNSKGVLRYRLKDEN